MATIKEKLAALGSPIRKLTIVSRDGDTQVDFWYRRPTSYKDRILREAMSEEYASAIKKLKEVPPDGESKASEFHKSFVLLGAEKCARIVVNSDFRAIRADSIRTLGIEEPESSKTQEHDDWWNELEPILKTNMDSANSAMQDLGIEELASRCLEIQLNTSAQERAYEVYRLNLVLDSVYDKSEDGEYVPVFETRDEIEQTLPADIIEDLSNLIAEEVRKARDFPLKDRATT